MAAQRMISKTSTSCTVAHSDHARCRYGPTGLHRGSAHRCRYGPAGRPHSV